MVRAGSSLTFSLAGSTQNYLPMTAGDLRSAVLGGLGPYLDVLDLTITPPGLIGGVLNFELIQWTYTGSITVRPRSDYADTGDVASIVAHAFYVSSGGLPTVSLLAQHDPIGGQIAPDDAFGGIGDVLRGVQTTTIVVLGLVVLALWVVASGKNVGDLRRYL